MCWKGRLYILLLGTYSGHMQAFFSALMNCFSNVRCHCGGLPVLRCFYLLSQREFWHLFLGVMSQQLVCTVVNEPSVCASGVSGFK